MTAAREALADLIRQGRRRFYEARSEWAADESETMPYPTATEDERIIDAILSAFPGIRETIEGEVRAPTPPRARIDSPVARFQHNWNYLARELHAAHGGKPGKQNGDGCAGHARNFLTLAAAQERFESLGGLR